MQTHANIPGLKGDLDSGFSSAKFVRWLLVILAFLIALPLMIFLIALAFSSFKDGLAEGTPLEDLIGMAGGPLMFAMIIAIYLELFAIRMRFVPYRNLPDKIVYLRGKVYRLLVPIFLALITLFSAASLPGIFEEFDSYDPLHYIVVGVIVLAFGGGAFVTAFIAANPSAWFSKAAGIALTRQGLQFSYPIWSQPRSFAWRDIEDLRLSKYYLSVILKNPERYGFGRRTTLLRRLLGLGAAPYAHLFGFPARPKRILEEAQAFRARALATANPD